MGRTAGILGGFVLLLCVMQAIADEEVAEVAVESGCVTPEGEPIAVGESLIYANCTRTCRCYDDGGEPECNDMQCPVNTECQMDKCACAVPFIYNGVECAHACNFPKYRGPCSSKIKRYFFNMRTRMCVPFFYSGCGKTPNNFETPEECRARCDQFSAPGQCLQPMDAGHCDQFETRYFFNSVMNKCVAFQYSGCEGNANNFESKVACKQTCGVEEEAVEAVEAEEAEEAEEEEEEEDTD